jgi:5-hydroxyisourate hydrolase
MSAITTHVLDLSAGRPASGVSVQLELAGEGDTWITLARAKTNADGRANELVAAGSKLDAGRYRLRFGTGEYFAAKGIESFHPEVTVTFEVRDASQHHHVPLLLSPFGYSTYRGS